MKKIISLTLLLVFLSNSIYLTNAQNSAYSCNSQEVNDYQIDNENGVIKYNTLNDSEYKNLDIYINPLSKDFSWWDEMIKNKNIASLEFAENNKQYLLWNGKKYDTYDFVGGDDFGIYLFFSQDKTSVSYISGDYSKNEMFVIKDGIKQKSYLAISKILNYAPKSNFLVYDAINKDYKKIININGVEVSDYQFDSFPDLKYSKDGKILYALGSIGDKNTLIRCNISEDKIDNNISSLTEKELQVVKNIGEKINKMTNTKKEKYKKQLNQYFTKFNEGTRNYEIVRKLLEIIK